MRPIQNDEVVHVAGLGTQIQIMHPLMINMTVEEFYIVDYFMDSPELMNNIRLYLDSEDDPLECENLISLKRCKIPVENFRPRSDIFYYTYHLNHLNEYSLNYESYPILILKPPDNYFIIRLNEDRILWNFIFCFKL